MNSGNTESARQSIDSLITLNGESAELLFAKAQCTLDADSAVHIYRKIYTDYESDPYAAKSLLRLAQYHAVRDEQTDVATDVRYLKERFPNSDELHSAEQLLPATKTTEVASNPLEPTPRKTHSTTILGAGTPEAKSNAAPATSSGIVYAVQLGAFGMKANAESVKASAQKYYQTDVVERKRGDQLLYVVLAGSFSSKEDAEKALALLSSKTSKNGFVVLR